MRAGDRSAAYFAALLACIGTSLAQPAMAAEDAAAQWFRDLAETRNFTLGRPVAALPTADGRSVLFLRSGPRDRLQSLYALDVGSGAVRELASPASLSGTATETLTTEEKARRERQRMVSSGLTQFEAAKRGNAVLVTLSGRLYAIDRDTGNSRALPGEAWLDPRLSPDGTQVAAVRGGELYRLPLDGGAAARLSSGAGANVSNGLAEFVAQEEMSRSRGFWWSPDGSALAYQQTDVSGVEQRWIFDPLQPERAPNAVRYPRPGGANASVRLGVVAAAGGATTWLQWDREAYPYLTRVTWIPAAGKQPARPVALVMNRAQTEALLLAFDAKTGRATTLLTERDPAWIELDGSDEMPAFLADGRFLFSSDRDGSKRIGLHAADGTFLRALTPENFGDVRLVRADQARGELVFTGGPDPRQQQIWRGTLTGAAPVLLGDEPGEHKARAEGDLLTDQMNLADGTQMTVLRDREGVRKAVLPDFAETAPPAPAVQFLQAGDYDAAIVRPRAFDPEKRYPVLLWVYAGPHAKMVRLAPSLYREQQWFADQGYVVVIVDGHGTPGRSRDWLRAIHGDLITTPLRDQVFGLQALGEKHAELDLTRVGVMGWSFGGYFSAMAVLQRPDVFACGIAGAPVVDWRDYDTFYTERYLGLLPAEGAAYDKSSVLTYADRLQRPLLIEHGLTDDNVFVQHALKLDQALLRAGKPHDLLLLPGTHMLADPKLKLAERLRTALFLARCLQVPSTGKGGA